MNLVLDAFERVLYPTGAASARRRASTSGLVTAATGPLSNTSVPSSQAIFGHHHHNHNHHHHPNHHHQRVAATATRRRSGTPNGGGSGSGGGGTAAAAGSNSYMAICQSNSLTGITRHQHHPQHQHIELYSSNEVPTTTTTTTASATMSQHGGGPPATRSRSTAGGRRKKSMHVQRKQSVASLLFSALASPTISGGDSTHKIRRRQSRMTGSGNGPPSRQWSVPERAAAAGGTSGGEDEAEDGEEEEPFHLIQKAQSMALSSSPGARSPPIRQLSGEEPPISSSSSAMGSPLPMGFPCQSSPSSSSSSGSFLLGFVPPPSAAAGNRAAATAFRPILGGRGHPSESACLADWIRLRSAEANIRQAFLLRCVDPEPAFPFFQLVNVNDPEETIRLADDLAQNGNAQYGCFEELFALEKATKGAGFRGSQGTIGQNQRQPEPEEGGRESTTATATAPTGTSITSNSTTINQQHHPNHPHYSSSQSGGVTPSNDGHSMARGGGQHQHHGFILVCFRLLDEDSDGSPGNGSAGGGSAELENSWLSWTGAGQIYKYSPRSWALRRLSLLRRVHCPISTLGGSSASSAAPFAYVLVCEFNSILHPSNALAALDMCERLRARNCGLVALYQVRQSFATSDEHFHSVQSLCGVPSSLSPHWSPHQLRRQQLARMGRSQDERGRQGGGALLRMIHGREGSLGWDQPQPTAPNPIPPTTTSTTTAIQTQPGIPLLQHHHLHQQQQQPHHWRGEPGIGTTL